MVAYVGFT